jgi:flagellar protein FlaG
MSFQISSIPSSSTRPAAAESFNYDSVPKQRDEGDNLRSTSELKKAERTGSKLSVSDEQMVKMVDRAIKAMQGPHTSAELSVHDATNTIMIKIINTDTGEMIREIPPEKTLDIVAKLIEVNGLLIDTKV